MVYLNDIIIYFKSMAEYVKHLDWIFGQLKCVGLKIKIEKYKFAKSEIKLLDYWILAKRIIPNLGKVAAIKTLKWPITILKLRGFLEAVGFFRKYIQGFEQIAKPLNNMILIKFKNCWISEMDEV